DIEHEHAQPAVFLVRTGTSTVRRLADAGDRGERSVDETDHRTDHDLVHGFGEPVAALFPAAAVQVAGALELEKNRLEELDGNEFLAGDLHDPQEFASVLVSDSKIDERPQGVFAAFGQSHG